MKATKQMLSSIWTMEYEIHPIINQDADGKNLNPLNENEFNEKLMKATKRLIQSVWTLEYEITKDDKLKILHYSRNDTEGYLKETELLQHSLIETDERIVVEVLLRPYHPHEWVTMENATQRYEVENPKYIFDYQ